MTIRRKLALIVGSAALGTAAQLVTPAASAWAGVYTQGEFDATLSVVACQNDGGGCSQPNPYVRFNTAAYSDMVVGTHMVGATGSISWTFDHQVFRGQASSCQ